MNNILVCGFSIKDIVELISNEKEYSKTTYEKKIDNKYYEANIKFNFIEFSLEKEQLIENIDEENTQALILVFNNYNQEFSFLQKHYQQLKESLIFETMICVGEENEKVKEWCLNEFIEFLPLNNNYKNNIHLDRIHEGIYSLIF
jgi:hypothetical protein